VFLDTVEKLKPKIVVAENVTGLIKGNAKGYVNEIVKRFRELGYDVQIFKLNAALMNVPQTRERVFFIANNQDYPKLKLNFNGEPILFRQVRTEKGEPIRGEKTKNRLDKMQRGDMCIADIVRRTENGREVCFNTKIIWDDKVCLTITANGTFIRAYDKNAFSEDDYRNVSSFPQDYDFMNQSAHYVGGMSVPPNMMANIATEIYNQWLK